MDVHALRPENEEKRDNKGIGKGRASPPFLRSSKRPSGGQPPQVIIFKIFGTINDPSSKPSALRMIFLITQDQMESFLSRAIRRHRRMSTLCVRGVEAPVSRIQPERPRPASHRQSTLWRGSHHLAVLDHSSVRGREAGSGNMGKSRKSAVATGGRIARADHDRY